MDEQTNNIEGLEPLISVQQLAEYLDVPPQRIYDWRMAGIGPKGHRLGRELRFPISEVRRWLAEHAETAESR